MGEKTNTSKSIDLGFAAYRIACLLGVKVCLIVFGIIFLVALIILITLPLSCNQELTDRIKDETAIAYVKTGDYFDYDWELLLVKDSTYYNNDVSKTNPIDSLMDMTILTETIKTVVKLDDGGTNTTYEEYIYSGAQVYPRTKQYYESSQEVLYTAESFGEAFLSLPESYQEFFQNEKETMYIRFNHKYLTKEEIITKYFPDKDIAAQFEFVYTSHLIANYIFVCDTEINNKWNIEGTKNYGDITFSTGKIPITYYCQTDTRWVNSPYGDSTIGRAGCGPTALAIVISSLKKDTVQPSTVAQWAYINGYKAKYGGSYHSLMAAAGNNWSLKVKSGVTSAEEVRKALSSGKLLIAIMGPGEFTRGGHYIVLRGITESGKILIADPNSYTRSQNEYDLSLISSQAKAGFWVFSN